MINRYIIEYQNEIDFMKKSRSLKKYNMLSYKKLMFDILPSLRDGRFLGDILSKSEDNNIIEYKVILPADSMFIKVHGECTLYYQVSIKEKKVLLKNITPEDILLEGHQSELKTYKGVMISKKNAEKDIFKINLLNMLNNDK